MLLTKGVIVVKENLSSEGTSFFLDRSDFTVMRGSEYYLQIFEKAELEVILEEKFEEFPDDCLPVWKFCLRPKGQKSETQNQK